ncbi:AAA family ATPase [Helicobacter cynogastricus]|uniref:AAA family ATPase n=1 Tax=Helicobacter cynogastricus TaxID=329937 RepID=UPI000CF1858D|nr:AAA family ATPase [Helicobacter cynogastricus]
MHLGKELEAFIAEFGLSQAQVARSINKSPALISSYIKGTYKAKDVSQLEKSLQDFMASHRTNATQRHEIAQFEIKPLENFKNAHFIIDQAVVCQESCLLYGQAGSGKSESLKAYAQKTPQSVLLEVVPEVSNKDFLKGLCELLGASPAKSVAQTILNLSKRLGERESILLVDEAEHLKTSSLEALRRLQDFTNTPMVLCGTPQLLKNLKGKNGELLQLYSRISLKYEFGTPSKADFTLLFGDLGASLQAITNNLRRACKIYKMASRFSQINGGDLAQSIQIVASMSILD